MNKTKYKELKQMLESCTRVELDTVKGVVSCLIQTKGFEQDLQAYEKELLEE